MQSCTVALLTEEAPSEDRDHQSRGNPAGAGSPRLAFWNMERRIREFGFAVGGCGSYIDYARARKSGLHRGACHAQRTSSRPMKLEIDGEL